MVRPAPLLAAVPLRDVAQRHRRAAVPGIGRLRVPAAHDRRIGMGRSPRELQVGEVRRGREPQREAVDVEFASQAAGERGERLHDAEAVDLQPMPIRGGLGRGDDAGDARERALQGEQEVVVLHLFQRPRRGRAAGVASERVEPPAEAHRFVADDRGELLAPRGLHCVVFDDRLDRGADAGESRARLLGQRLHQPIALLAALHGARDIVERQHQPGDGGRAAVLGRAEDGRHVRSDQLAARRRRDELRDRTRLALVQAFADDVERMGDQIAVDDAEDGAPQADDARGGGASGTVEQRARGVVVEQDQSVGIAHEHAARHIGHQRGEPVLLLLELGVRVAHAQLDVAQRGLVPVGERIDQPREPRRLDWAVVGQPVRRVGGEDDARALAELRHPLDVGPEPGADEQPERDQHEEREQHDEPGGIVERPRERAAQLRRHARPQHGHLRGIHRDDDGEEGRHGQRELPAQVEAARRGRILRRRPRPGPRAERRDAGGLRFPRLAHPAVSPRACA